MMAELAGVTTVVVIGGGYIGLEAAAVLTKFGKQVTVLEALDRVLARVAGEPLSRFYEAEHRAHGVDVRLGAVDGRRLPGSATDEPARVTGVRLADGEVMPAEMVIVGIGIVPAVEPLIAAGAEGGNGVDGRRAIAAPACPTSSRSATARRTPMPSPTARRSAWNRCRTPTTRRPSSPGRSAGRRGRAYHAVPWFWSNQYDLRLQTVGLSTGIDAGGPARRSRERAASRSIYLKQGRVIALDCVNAVKDYVQGKGLITAGATPDVERLADPAVALKDVLS